MMLRMTTFVAALLLTAPAFAETSQKPMAMDHASHGGVMAAHMQAMDKMMTGMEGMSETGNPDADFLLMMIPHHQSALDMAKIELKHGKDKETRALAENIIKAQETEIAQMKAMLKRMGVK